MPIDIVRLFGSRFHAIANDAEWRAGITLWLKSFHQVPAASIPDDDVELARLAELGRDLKMWKKLRAGALHGWVKCSDGRLYHPVVAEKALEAFKKKEFYRERSKKANAKRWSGVDTRHEPEGAEGTRAGVETLPRETDQGQHEASNKESFKEPIRTPSASQGTVKGQGHITLANANAAEAPKTPPEPDVAVSAEAHLWDAGKRFLASRGVAPSKLGGLIGKWKRDFGTASVIEALGVAQTEPDLVDPIPFIEKVLRRRRGDDPGGFSIGGVRMNSPC